MALRKTLNEVVDAVREEARLSTNASRGVENRDHIVRLIKRYYEELTEERDWPFLRILRGDAGKAMAAGQRYYDFPTGLDPLRIDKVWHFWGNTWDEITQGITPDEYSIHDSDADVRADPVERWDRYGATQFEVWPMPASVSGEVRFEGSKIVEQITGNDSRLDMDHILLSLLVAGEILIETKNPEGAEVKLARASKRYNTLKGGYGDKQRFTLGGGMVHDGSRGWPRHPIFINKST